jgi:hypothetical protein
LRKELDFGKYSSHLGQGLFADGVVLALSKYFRTSNLDERSKNSLINAGHFLTEAIEGGKPPVIIYQSPEGASSAKAFAHAIDAMTISVSSNKEQAINYLNDLLSTVNKLSTGEKVSNEDIDKVDAFFSRYGQIQLQRSKAMLELV